MTNNLESNVVIVTRHRALVKYLKEIGVDENAKVIAHAKVEQIKGKHVIGVLPLHMASQALSITTVGLDLPFRLRSEDELSLDEVRKYATGLNTYKVERIERTSVEDFSKINFD